MELIPRYLSDTIRCISAGRQEMQHILEQRYDHIFYTGSANVGKIVYAEAARHLTPVTRAGRFSSGHCHGISQCRVVGETYRCCQVQQC